MGVDWETFICCFCLALYLSTALERVAPLHCFTDAESQGNQHIEKHLCLHAQGPAAAQLNALTAQFEAMRPEIRLALQRGAREQRRLVGQVIWVCFYFVSFLVNFLYKNAMYT